MEFSYEEGRWIIRAGWILLFLLAILGAIGEYLDWWNLVGEVLMTVGTVGGLVLAGVDFVNGASREQVRSLHDRLGSMDGTLGRMDGTLGGVEDTLDSVDGKLDRLDRLEVIEEALIAEDEQVSKLDVVQVELDRQTGVLDRQLSVLGEIRDRL